MQSSTMVVTLLEKNSGKTFGKSILLILFPFNDSVSRRLYKLMSFDFLTAFQRYFEFPGKMPRPTFAGFSTLINAQMFLLITYEAKWPLNIFLFLK